jgi:hypothetical protein
MSDTSETSAIDEKKESTNPSPTDPATETSAFFMNLVWQLFYLFILIIAGGSMLWSAKVAQTGLMPTDIDAEPFNSNTLQIPPIPINIDVVKTKDDSGDPIIKSTKIEFPVEENMNIIKFGIFGLESIREWTDGPKSSPFWVYLGTIWQKMAVNLSSTMSSFYNILNQTCSESVIIFIIPYLLFFISPFIFMGLGLVNLFYGVFLWFSQIPLLFSERDGCYEEGVFNKEGEPVYEKEFNKDTGKWVNKLGENREPIQIMKTRIKWRVPDGAMKTHWGRSILYTIFAILGLFWGVGPFMIFYFGLRSTLSALFLPFYLKANILGENSDEPIDEKGKPKNYTWSTAIANILKYKLSVIMYIVSYLIVKDAYFSLGALGAVIAIVACIFVYSFYPNIYKPQTDIPTATLDLASYDKPIPSKNEFAGEIDESKCKEGMASGKKTVIKTPSISIPSVKNPFSRKAKGVAANTSDSTTGEKTFTSVTPAGKEAKMEPSAQPAPGSEVEMKTFGTNAQPIAEEPPLTYPSTTQYQFPLVEETAPPKPEPPRATLQKDGKYINSPGQNLLAPRSQSSEPFSENPAQNRNRKGSAAELNDQLGGSRKRQSRKNK